MKRIILLSVLAFSLSSCLSDLDNYEYPTGGIKGIILDSETNEPIQLPVQGSTGVVVNMYEQNTNATQSVDFYAKMDGSFENSKIFNCDYKIIVNGPFISACEGNVTVNGPTEFDLQATPYSRIYVSTDVTGRKVTINFKAIPTKSSFNISEVYGYWNFAPGVDNGSANYSEKLTSSETEGSFVFDLTDNSTYLNNLHKIKSNGYKIYLRVGAKTEGIINYSKIVEVNIE